MRRSLIFLWLLSFSYLHAQVDGRTAASSQNLSPADLPSAKLTFSAPDLDSPLDLPAPIMNGAAVCGPEGRAFFEFLTPPPMYNHRVIYSVAPDGKTTRYALEQIVDLTKPLIVSFDAGLSKVAMLLRAEAPGEARPSSFGYYLALFNYDGKLDSYSKLELGFQPSKVAQLNDDGFLIIGTDTGTARVRFVEVDSSGNLLRDLGSDPNVPSEQRLKNMEQSLHISGPKSNVPAWMAISAALSVFRPVHSSQGLLIFEPGAGAQVIEFLRSGEIHTLKLKLPVGQAPDSVIAGYGKWFVRTYQQGSDSRSDLYQVNPETGDTTERIDTSGVPAGSIACPTDSGFYGIRWIDKKPYLIFGDLR